jgi:hypothetical protein
MRKRYLMVPATVLAALGLAAASALPASARGNQQSGPVVATGTVTDAKGHAVAGAAVSLYSWPPASALKSLRLGQTVPTRLVGSAQTTASGAYVIKMTHPAAAEAEAAPGGIVNLELDARSPTSFGIYSFSRRVVRTAHGVLLDDATTDGAPHAVPAEDVSIAMAATGAGPIPLAIPCGWAKLKTYKPSWSVLEGTYSTTGYIKESFSYDTGQSSNLGVGQSTSGKKGTFKEDGTASASATFGEDFRSHYGDSSFRYETEFIHSKFGYSCGSGYTKYETKPTDYAGGAKSVRSGAPKASYCIFQQAGSTAHKKTTAAFTFALGFEIPAIGATLSAQTGYDSEGEVTYHFIHQGNLCGTNVYPGQIPKRLVAEHT